MPLHDLIPAAMLGVMVVGVACALFGRGRAVGGTVIVLLLLFGTSFWFPEPPPANGARLHWFPASLAVLILTVPLLVVAALLGWIVRGLLAPPGKGTGHDRDV